MANLINGEVVKILGENARESSCKSCGEKVARGQGIKLRFPENTYCICKKCVENGRPFQPFNVKASKKSSANCINHRVVVNVSENNADRFWIESYGFTKFKGYHSASFNNAQSIGSLANNLFKVGTVKVGLEDCGLVVINSVDDYDKFTKEVCMRNFEQ